MFRGEVVLELNPRFLLAGGILLILHMGGGGGGGGREKKILSICINLRILSDVVMMSLFPIHLLTYVHVFL